MRLPSFVSVSGPRGSVRRLPEMNRKTKIGVVKGLYRYPVKSMAGEPLASVEMGLHGFEGDRRYAFMIAGSKSNVPWLTASKLPRLISYKPRMTGSTPGVVTPSGEHLELNSDALRRELSTAFGSDIQLVHLKNGIFDEGEISIISTSTINEIERRSGHKLDIRRFRPNIVVDLTEDIPFQEDRWVGKIVAVGEENNSIAVTMRDLRCVMVNFDPDTVASNHEVLKTVVRLNETCAGVYGCALRSGTISSGEPLYISEE